MLLQVVGSAHHPCFKTSRKAYACQGCRQARRSRLPLYGHTAFLLCLALIRHPVSVKDRQLSVYDGLVLPRSCPLFRNVKHSQVQHFEQAVVFRENGFGLGHFAKLTIEAFNCVCRIDQPAELLRELEVGAQVRPVRPPRDGDLGVFPVPALCKPVQGFFRGCFVNGRIYLLQIGH